MKKKIDWSLLVLSIFLFLFLYVYTETNILNTSGHFNYHISDFVGYLLFWSLTLFVLSLLASKLEASKYKIWLIISILASIISMLIAYAVGDGNSSIISINGEFITWFFTGLYSLVSIIYFIVQFFKNKKQSTLV